MARFIAISLIIDIDPREELVPFADDLPPATAVSFAERRVLYHETLHLWQQATAAFLIRCTEEDWVRMRTYERTGGLQRESMTAAEYVRVYPEATYSALDLQECLARFWELQAYDPLLVMSEESQSSKRVVDERLKELLRRLMDAPGADGPEAPLALAMEFAAGRYARPFLSLAARVGNSMAARLFPLAAFFALQTESPVQFYARLVDSVIPALERQLVARKLADIWQAWYPTVRRNADELHQEMFGAGIGFGMDVLRRSVLLEHPGYAYLLERIDGFVAQAAQMIGSAHEILQREPEFPASLLRRAQEVQDRYEETAQAAIAAMARQGGESYQPSRRPEVREGLIDQYQDAAVWAREPVTPGWLTEFVAACPKGGKSVLSPSDPTSMLSDHLVPPCIRAGQRIVPSIPLLWQSYNGVAELTGHCLDVERRWLRFREVCRGF
jgi:hypothetical protein